MNLNRIERLFLAHSMVVQVQQLKLNLNRIESSLVPSKIGFRLPLKLNLNRIESYSDAMRDVSGYLLKLNLNRIERYFFDRTTIGIFC